MKENEFTLTNEAGKQTVCELLFTFQRTTTGTHYMVYTDHTPDQWGYETVFASIYHPDDPNAPIEGIETDEEWDMVDWVLETVQDRTDDEPQLADDILLTACYI